MMDHLLCLCLNMDTPFKIESLSAQDVAMMRDALRTFSIGVLLMQFVFNQGSCHKDN